jgi:threonine/homoserine/homoserine lactone efflux protein
MSQTQLTLDLLTAMITPAVLISACGTLIFSTSTRLARIVDRVRELTKAMDTLYAGAEGDFLDERRAEVERQLSMHARRGRLIQWSLTSYYVSLGLFVGSAAAIGLVAFLHVAHWLPTTLGMLGTFALFYASVLLINETRLAIRSVNAEMSFALRLRDLHVTRHQEGER